MKTVENGYRYDDRLWCTGKRRNNLLNDGRLRVTGKVGWYGYCLLPFITVFHLIPSIS
jgi:hypothetical protein